MSKTIKFFRWLRYLILLAVLFVIAGAIGVQYFKSDYLSHGTYCLGEYAVQLPVSEWGYPIILNYEQIGSFKLLLFALGLNTGIDGHPVDVVGFDRELQKGGVLGYLFIASTKLGLGRTTLKFLSHKESLLVKHNSLNFPITKLTLLVAQRSKNSCIKEHEKDCKTFILPNNLIFIEYPIVSGNKQYMYYSVGNEAFDLSFNLPIEEDFKSTLSRVKFGHCPL